MTGYHVFAKRLVIITVLAGAGYFSALWALSASWSAAYWLLVFSFATTDIATSALFFPSIRSLGWAAWLVPFVPTVIMITVVHRDRPGPIASALLMDAVFLLVPAIIACVVMVPAIHYVERELQYFRPERK